MKEFRLPAKFFIIFSLLFSIPASYIAVYVQSYLNGLNPQNILQQLASLGVIEAPTTVAILLVLFWIIDRYLWKVKLINKIPGIPLNINGRYEGTLVSSYEENPTHKIAIEIRQFLTKISIKLYTQNSSSFSTTSVIGINSQDNWALHYLYKNNPQTVNHNEDMRSHEGGAFLEIINGGQQMKGSYFNNTRDRGRHGSIDVKWITSSCLGRF